MVRFQMKECVISNQETVRGKERKRARTEEVRRMN